MASVEDIVECPQCGKKAFLEFHTRTFEEEIICPVCGYGESTRPVVDRQRQRKDSHNREWFKRRKACPEQGRRDGERIFRTMKHAGFGAYYLAQRNGVGVLGAVNCKVTPEMIANFKREMAKLAMDPQKCFLTRWNPKRDCIENLIGRVPKRFP